MPNIKFILDRTLNKDDSELVVGLDNEPQSAKSFISKEYKDLSGFFEGNLLDETVKKCMPFLDAMTSGYIIPFFQDHIISIAKTSPNLKTTTAVENPDLKDVHIITLLEPSSIFHYPHQLPKNYQDSERPLGKFTNKWLIKTPPGYSCLFIHPLNQPKTDYELAAGIVDTDVYDKIIMFPFYIRKQFTKSQIQIHCQKGNPMVQVIPFKRESWTSWSGIDTNFGKSTQGFGLLVDMYKKTFWQKKKYD